MEGWTDGQSRDNQRAKKVVSDGPGLVDFGFGLVNSVLNLPDGQVNRPFPSSKKSHFQNEAKCETFVVKMSFICIIIKTHFHINGFALSLALKVRFFGTRKWPILLGHSNYRRIVINSANQKGFPG